ncbi:MAG: hypothetical protein QXL76_00730 [Candidatus Rehaiarchaeum fermentans]|nr:hypothetical protein [Candidatus Rehaiarchaeum fermentans]
MNKAILFYLILLIPLILVLSITYYYYFKFQNILQVRNVSINMSPICKNKPVYLLFVASNCKYCNESYFAFLNVTSKYGDWLTKYEYISLYTCAYVLNLSQPNSTSALSSSALNYSLNIFNNYSNGYVPFFVFNGRYIKSGGFLTFKEAVSFISKYFNQSYSYFLNNS